MMMKIMIAFSAALSLVSINAAFADNDSANTYKTLCQGCHGADGAKTPAPGVHPLKGQSASDIEKKLEGYKSGSYGGSNKQVMAGVAKRLSDDQVKGVAEYASKL